MHTAVAGGSQFRGGAGESGTAQVLDAHNNVGVVEVKAAFDEDLLCEGVAYLDGGEFLVGFSASLCGAVVEGFGGKDGNAADAIESGGGAEEDNLVAFTGGEGQVEVVYTHGAHAESVHQWVTGVGFVKDGFATDVGEA